MRTPSGPSSAGSSNNSGYSQQPMNGQAPPRQPHHLSQHGSNPSLHLNSNNNPPPHGQHTHGPVPPHLQRVNPHHASNPHLAPQQQHLSPGAHPPPPQRPMHIRQPSNMPHLLPSKPSPNSLQAGIHPHHSPGVNPNPSPSNMVPPPHISPQNPIHNNMQRLPNGFQPPSHPNDYPGDTQPNRFQPPHPINSAQSHPNAPPPNIQQRQHPQISPWSMVRLQEWVTFPPITTSLLPPSPINSILLLNPIISNPTDLLTSISLT